MTSHSRWPDVLLRDVLTSVNRREVVVSDRQYRLLGVRLDGNGPFHRETVTGTQTSAASLYKVEEGDFIYSRLFAWRGAFGVIDSTLDGCYVSGEFPTFRCKVDRLDSRYLNYWFRLRDTLTAVEAKCSGSTPLTRNRFKEQYFVDLQIPLPPIAEQRRIVARIEGLAGQINEARRLREELEADGEVLWKSGLSRMLQDSDAESVALESACAEIVDNLHSTPRYDGDEFPCVRSQDVGWGTIDYKGAMRTSAGEFVERTRRAEPRLGDIVFVREGDVGRCGVVDGTRRFSLGQRVMMFRPALFMDSKFLMFSLMSREVLDMQILKAKTGTTSHHVNIRHLRRVKVPFPALFDQRRIAARVDALKADIDRLQALQAGTSNELDALLPSILNKAFKGEL